jgi:hypothetical protein
MSGDAALKKLLCKYIERTRRAEKAGRHEQAEGLRRRRDHLSKLTSLRHRLERWRAESVWRDHEYEGAGRRRGEE